MTLMIDAEMAAIHRALSDPAEHGFILLADGERSRSPGIYVWTLIGARLRCIQGSSSVIYIGKANINDLRPLGHPGSDEIAVNHYANAFWYSWWRKKRRLEVWFRKESNRKEAEKLFLLSYFRFHYQLPILNKKIEGGWDIRQRLGDAVFSEVQTYLNSDHPEFPFGLIQNTGPFRC